MQLHYSVLSMYGMKLHEVKLKRADQWKYFG